MAKKTVTELIALCGHQFEKQSLMLPLWQTLADHFYPERADFTTVRNLGVELADQLIDSYPLLIRRDLGNAISSMLRDGEWFEMTVRGNDTNHEGKQWLEWGTRRLRGLMDDRVAGFVRATKEADHDYVTFGQPVMSVEMNRNAAGLLFRTWHLRDCAWWDGSDGHVEGVVRKWKPTYHNLMADFPADKLHPSIATDARREPFKRADIRHLVMPARMYGDDRIEAKFKFVSLFIDVAHQHLIEEVGINHRYYLVPRFQTVACSPYAYSPATVVGLPDARALQAMTHTLIEAGERYARPPLVGVGGKAIRGDVDLSPDGITWVDSEYDERTGIALRPLVQDRGGFPIGLEMRQSVVQILSSAFYLNKLSLPEVSREMTAYEVQERMKQFRRENLPLFAPIEAEYNGQLCEMAFEIALANGMLGSFMDIPDSLKGADVEFKFQSPLSEAEEEKKGQMFAQVSQMLAAAAEFDPAVSANIDFDVALRDAIDGIGVPATWLAGVEQVMQAREGIAARQAAEFALQAQAAQ